LTDRTGCLEDTRDVVVFAAVVAVLSVGAITEVWPETVDSPVVGWTGGWLGIPELYLQDLPLNFGAAGVLDGGSVVATQLRVERADWWKSQCSLGEPESGE